MKTQVETVSIQCTVHNKPCLLDFLENLVALGNDHSAVIITGEGICFRCKKLFLFSISQATLMVPDFVNFSKTCENYDVTLLESCRYIGTRLPG